jgi:hypothetical protein
MHYNPGVDSAYSNSSEYQEYLLGVREAIA